MGLLSDYILFNECNFYFEGDAPLSDEDQLFDEVRQAVKEVRADWYSLATELDIDYGTRKVIRSLL